MPEPFLRLSVDQFEERLREQLFTRRITSFHVHHTWKPRHKDFKGEKTIRGMANYHLAQGFSDIAQHISLDPDGRVWTGRDWNRPPASAKGFNGTSERGPFMMEMIGDFDRGQDPFGGAQEAAAIRIVALVLAAFDLEPKDVIFHNEMSPKSCPGTGIAKAAFVAAVAVELGKLPTGWAQLEPSSRDLQARSAADLDLPEAEETYRDEMLRLVADQDPAEEVDADARAGNELTPRMLQDLQPHVINMRRGRFAADDLFETNAGTVRAIFEEVRRRADALPPGQKLPIVFWAHGGLVSQRSALEKAHSDIWWWNENDVYPIYFVWHTSLGTAIADALRGASQRVAGRRDFWDYTTDPILEGLIRLSGLGALAWDSMKLSAAESVTDPDDGAAFVAAELGNLLATHGNRVEIHAIGHSAGAVLHSHFVPAVVAQGGRFESVQFLAPAIRIDEFRRRLEPHAGAGFGPLTIYAMRRQLERADDCIRIYRKSLLYLINGALERETNAPILGLDDWLHRDAAIARAFGLTGGGAPIGSVVWSRSDGSKATKHGDFDNDVATMDSVMRTVLGGAPTVSYARAVVPADRDAAFRGDSEVVPEALRPFVVDAPVRAEQPPISTTPYCCCKPTTTPAPTTPQGGPTLPVTGRRRALCVGIDAYPTRPLTGCVNDARAWAAALTAIGFEAPELLFDSSATAQGILDALGRLITNSAPGDELVFQYAGHGTFVPDHDGDETTGNDQAICPYDFMSGRLLIDDDLADVFARIPNGVRLTCFFDSCYSGTVTRFAIGNASLPLTSDTRVRFMPLDPEVQQRYEDLRRRSPARRAISRGPDSMREVVFSACTESEVALESNGNGHFTRNTTPLLSFSGQLSNQAFIDLVTSRFVPPGQQHPMLDASEAGKRATFLVAARQ